MEEWYIQKDDVAQGPFAVCVIHRLLNAQRITAKELVSQDQVLWEPLSQVPQLLPDELFCYIDFTHES